jgi:hypothetical protein
MNQNETSIHPDSSMPVKQGSPMAAGFSFRLGGKSVQAEAATCLYRAVDAEAMTTRCLMLTKDGRFAYLDRVIGGKGVYGAEEWSPGRAMRFLMQHGEGDIVDEFPDIFRKRMPAAPKARKMASPKSRPTEPYLFPLH